MLEKCNIYSIFSIHVKVQKLYDFTHLKPDLGWILIAHDCIILNEINTHNLTIEFYVM